MNQATKRKFPWVALPIGGIGTVAAIVGILTYTAPDLAVRISPLLAQSVVADALITMGAIFMALEMILILQWIRNRRQTDSQAADTAVVRTRDKH